MNVDGFMAVVDRERTFIPSKNLPVFDDMCKRFLKALKEPEKHSLGIAADLWFHVKRLRSPNVKYLFPILPHRRRETKEQYLTRCITAADLKYPRDWIEN